jgi:WhiB family transcriptional regulator, redox-sensing transcriptional regulator
VTAVAERVDWELAACFGHDRPDLWFPSEHSTAASAVEARKICSRCPILAGCLAYALSRHEPHGVWGGLTTAQRQRYGRQDVEECDCGHKRVTHAGEGACRWCGCRGFVGVDRAPERRPP